MDSFGEVRSFVDLLDRYHAIAREAGVTGCYFWSYKRGALPTLKEGDIESAATIMGGRGPGYGATKVGPSVDPGSSRSRDNCSDAKIEVTTI